MRLSEVYGRLLEVYGTLLEVSGSSTVVTYYNWASSDAVESLLSSDMF